MSKQPRLLGCKFRQGCAQEPTELSSDGTLSRSARSNSTSGMGVIVLQNWQLVQRLMDEMRFRKLVDRPGIRRSSDERLSPAVLENDIFERHPAHRPEPAHRVTDRDQGIAVPIRRQPERRLRFFLEGEKIERRQ